MLSVYNKKTPTEPLENAQWEIFCQHYVTGSTFGNGAASYLEAYGESNGKTNPRIVAATSANNLLKKPIILARIRYLLENELGLTNEFVDRELAFVIAQSADLGAKVAAIREYNNLQGRIKRKLELSFKDASDAELDEQLRAVELELKAAQQLADERQHQKDLDQGMPHLTEEQLKKRM